MSGSSQKNTPETENMMLNEVWAKQRLALTTLAETAVCLCDVVVLNKHCHTRVPTYIHIYIYIYIYARAQTHTGPACFCVLVRSRPSLCGLVGFSNTHALCLCCAHRPPVVCLAPARHNLPSQHTHTPLSFSKTLF